MDLTQSGRQAGGGPAVAEVIVSVNEVVIQGLSAGTNTTTNVTARNNADESQPSAPVQSVVP